MKKILYVGWIGFNNFGDEWMWTMFQQMSNRHLNSKKYKVIPSLPGVDLKELSEYDTIVLGGGSLLIPGYVDVMHQAMRENKRIMIWGSGHDRLNRLVANHDRTFSSEPANHSEKYCNMIQEVVHNATYCCIRGPWTQDYLQECKVSLENVKISGDPAMLTSPPEIKKDHKRSEERWIGINWGTSYNRIYGKNEEQVENEIAFAAQRWIRQGYKVYIYIVWGPDLKSAKKLQQKIGFPEQVVLDPKVHTLESYLQFISNFDFTVNLKLHANILSAAANVPFICLGYRFKSYDFIHSMNLPNMIIPTHCSQIEADLLDTSTYILNNREFIIDHFHKLRQLVTTELEKNFIKKLCS